MPEPRTPFPHLRLHLAVAGLALVAAGRVDAQAPSVRADPGDAVEGALYSAPLLDEPGGAVVADLRGTANVMLLEDSGDWVRVRVEGWVPREFVDSLASSAPERIGLAALRAAPDRYQGETVRWNVQAVAMQRADSLRSDMRPGEDYLLVRDPNGEIGFAYVVVPPDLAAATTGLIPLQRVEIVATVRTGSSPLTGHPILELVEIVT